MENNEHQSRCAKTCASVPTDWKMIGTSVSSKLIQFKIGKKRAVKPTSHCSYYLI